MMIAMDEIIPTSEVVKNFSDCRKKVMEKSRLFIFKNNKPDLVMLNIAEYERLMDLADLLEDSHIISVLEERAKHDTGEMISEDVVNKMLEERLAAECV